MIYSRLLFRFLAAGFLTLLSAVGASAFEGKVAMTMTSGKNVHPISYYIKDSRMRTEMTITEDKKGKKLTAVSLFDLKSREMQVLMPEQKMYMTLSIPEPDTNGEGKGAPGFEFKPTGRKEKIAGYDAEEYAGISEGKRTEMWVTKELGQFVMANQGKPGRKPTQSAQWEKFMRDGNFFAMRVIQRAKEGAAEQFRTEVTNVEKVSLPDSLFVPPVDFKKLEMPNMGNMLKGLVPGH